MRSYIISSTEMSRTLSDVLNKVHYQGQSFEIKRGREVIARLIPSEPQKKVMKIQELGAFLNNLPGLGKSNQEAFAKDIDAIREQATPPEDLWD